MSVKTDPRFKYNGEDKEKDTELTSEEAKAKAKEERAKAKRKKQIIQACCIAGAVVLIIVLVMALINPIADSIDNEISDDVPVGYVTYNASRYFFRFDHKEGWYVKNDTGEFGFMQDAEKGLVVSLYPPETAEEQATEAPEDEVQDDGTVKYDDRVFVNFYYRDFDEGEKFNNSDAYSDFVSEINSGALGEQYSTATFGKTSVYKGRNEEFCCSSVEFIDKTTNNTINGTLYVSARSMAYCAVLVCYDNEADDLYKEYEEILKTTVDSFRFSVFDD